MKKLNHRQVHQCVGSCEEVCASINLVHVGRVIRDVMLVIGESCTVEVLANYLEDLSDQAMAVRQRLLDMVIRSTAPTSALDRSVPSGPKGKGRVCASRSRQAAG